jgi:hypothetical protein
MTGPFPPIEPFHPRDEDSRLQATASRISQLRRRRRVLGAGIAAAVVLAVVLPITLSGGPARSRSVQVIGQPTTTPALSPSTLAPAPTSTLALTTTVPSAPPTWTVRTVPSGVGILNDVTCPSATQCYAVGGHEFGSGPGWVIGSSDGGRSWQTLNRTRLAWLSAIACPTAHTCAAVGGTQAPGGQGWMPVAFTTTDAGLRWSSETIPSQLGALDDIACPSSTVCIAIGSGIARTTDGGATWVTATPPSGLGSLNSVTCPTSPFCMIGGAGTGSGASSPSMASVSHDSAVTWSRGVIAGGVSGLMQVSCSNANHCVGLIGSDATDSYGTGFPVITSDGGSTWERGSSATGQAVSCVGDFCMSVGALWNSQTNTFPGDAFNSTDGGLHWNPMSIHPQSSLTAVTCLSSTDCVAVGGNFQSGESPTLMTYAP